MSEPVRHALKEAEQAFKGDEGESRRRAALLNDLFSRAHWHSLRAYPTRSKAAVLIQYRHGGADEAVEVDPERFAQWLKRHANLSSITQTLHKKYEQIHHTECR